MSTEVKEKSKFRVSKIDQEIKHFQVNLNNEQLRSLGLTIVNEDGEEVQGEFSFLVEAVSLNLKDINVKN